MRVQRQNHHLIHSICLDVGDGGFRERMPVTHGDVTGGINATLTQEALKLPSLLFSDAAQWGTPTDRAIGLLGFPTAEGADQPGKWFLQRRTRQPDDLRIGKQVVEKGANILYSLGAAQIQQDNSDTGHTNPGNIGN